MYHGTILCCKDIDTAYMKLILNHIHYEVYTHGSKDSSPGKEAEVKNLDSTLTVSGTS